MRSLPDKTERQLLWLATTLLILGTLINLGKQPLYLEEPRRAIVSMEMVENGNLLVPTLLGDYYYNKPPVYNWLLIGSAFLLGGFSEWSLRLPTVLCLWMWAALVYALGRHYVHERFGWYSGLFLVTCGAFLYYFSLLAEIDIFYSLITFAAMAAFFHYGEHRRWWSAFLALYALSAVGFLTKGLPSLVFGGLTVLLWLGYTRQWKQLFHPAHWAGIGIFVLLTGGYYYGYHQYHDVGTLATVLWMESSRRTVAGEESGLLNFLQHLVVFPLNFWLNLLPTAGMLIIFLFWFRSEGRPPFPRFLQFCLLMLIGQIALYWLSPGERLRYVYMLFPMAIYGLTWLWQSLPRPHPADWWLRLVAGTFLTLLPVGALILIAIPDLDPVPYRTPIAVGLALLLSLIALFFWRKPQPGRTMAWLLLSVALSRWLFAGTILPQRALDSGAQRDRERAERIHQMVGDRPLHTVGSDKVIAYTSVAYLDLWRQRTVQREDQLQPGHFYLITQDSAHHPQVDTLLEYRYGDLTQYLIFLPEKN